MALTLDTVGDYLEQGERVSLRIGGKTHFTAMKRCAQIGDSYLLKAPVESPTEHATLFVRDHRLIVSIADETEPVHTRSRHTGRTEFDLRRTLEALDTHGPAFQQAADLAFYKNLFLVPPESLSRARLLVGAASFGNRQVPDAAWSRSSKKGLRVGIDGWLSSSRVVTGEEFLIAEEHFGILLGRHRRCWVTTALVFRRADCVFALHVRAARGIVCAMGPLIEAIVAPAGASPVSVRTLASDMTRSVFFWPELLRRQTGIAFPPPRRVDRTGIRVRRVVGRAAPA